MPAKLSLSIEHVQRLLTQGELRAARKALQRIERQGVSPEDEQSVRFSWTCLLHATKKYAEAATRAGTGLMKAQQDRDDRFISLFSEILSVIVAQQGRLTEAHRLAALATEHAPPKHFVRMSLWSASTASYCGRVEESEALLDQLLEAGASPAQIAMRRVANAGLVRDPALLESALAGLRSVDGRKVRHARTKTLRHYLRAIAELLGGNFDKAQRALAYANRENQRVLGDPELTVAIESASADVLLAKGTQLQRARKIAETAVKRSRRIGDPLVIAESKRVQARVLSACGLHREATKVFEDAVAIVRKHDMPALAHRVMCDACWHFSQPHAEASVQVRRARQLLSLAYVNAESLPHPIFRLEVGALEAMLADPSDPASIGTTLRELSEAAIDGLVSETAVRDWQTRLEARLRGSDDALDPAFLREAANQFHRSGGDRKAFHRALDRAIAAGALERADGNAAAAARELGVSRDTLYRWTVDEEKRGR